LPHHPLSGALDGLDDRKTILATTHQLRQPCTPIHQSGRRSRLANFVPTEFQEVHSLLLLGRSAKGVYTKFRNLDLLTEGGARGRPLKRALEDALVADRWQHVAGTTIGPPRSEYEPRRRFLMDNAGKRTHVLLTPRDLIHREILDPDDENIGFVRELLIDEVDWKVRFLHATQGGFLGLENAIS